MKWQDSRYLTKMRILKICPVKRKGEGDETDNCGGTAMKVLVACEESQEVCKAFRERGHEAYSCDIQECSGGHPEWHIKGNVLPLIRMGGGGFKQWMAIGILLQKNGT